MFKINKNISAICAVITLGMAYTEAHSFQLDFTNCNNTTPIVPRQWINSDDIDFLYLRGTNPTGALDLLAPINRAVNQINNAIEIDVNIGTLLNTSITTMTVGQSDGNQVGYGDGTILSGPNVLAAEFTRYWTNNCSFAALGQIIESDIVFNPNRTYRNTNFTGLSRGAPFDAELIMVHELGHTLGLNHSNWILSTMNSFYPNGGNVGRLNEPRLQTDDLKGLRTLYREPDTRINLIASAYKNLYGEVADDNQVKRVSDNAQVNVLNRGQTYFIDYTVANHSADSNVQSNVRVGFYLSANDWIQPNFDIFIGSTTIANMFNKTYSSSFWLQLPQNIPTGNYFLGYVVDDLGTVAEIDEDDNSVRLLNANGGTIFSVQ